MLRHASAPFLPKLATFGFPPGVLHALHLHAEFLLGFLGFLEQGAHVDVQAQDFVEFLDEFRGSPVVGRDVDVAHDGKRFNLRVLELQ